MKRFPTFAVWLVLFAACTAKNQGEPMQDVTRQEQSKDIAKEFTTLAEAWAKHCQSVRLSSNIHAYLDHPAYHGLVKLGRPAIPYIMERYEKDHLPWGFVLDEITGLRVIEDPDHFSPPKVRKRWIEWWRQQDLQRKSGKG